VRDMSKRKMLAVFIGPQAVGKSYHAQMVFKTNIDSNTKSTLVSLNYHALFHVKLTSIIDNVICKILNKCVLAKFYLNKPKTMLGSPQIYYAFLPLFCLIHLLAFIASEIRIFMCMLSNDLVIDQEGYAFKQIADLHYLAKYAGVSYESFMWKVLRKLYLLFLLNVMKKNLIIFHLELEYDELIKRYINRGLIEPSYYINTQNLVYRAFLSIFKSYSIRQISIYEVYTGGQKEQISKLIISKLNQLLL